MTQHDEFQRRTGDIIREKMMQLPDDFAVMSPEETRHMFHELRVHQIELEMQNEELRRTHAELEAVRARYVGLYDMAPVGYVTLNPKGLIQEANLTAAMLLGVSRESLINQRMSRYILPEDQNIWYERINRIVEAAKAVTIELRMVNTDNTSFRAQLVVSALRDDDDVSVLRVVMTDVTRQRQADERLCESHEQFMLAVNGSKDGIWDWDLRNNTLFLSPHWKEMIGYTDSELPNTYETFENRLHPDDKPGVLSYIRKYLEGHIPIYSLEFRFRHRTGAYLWILARGAALRDDSGVPYRMAGSHTDITERKQAEEDLRRNQAMLARTEHIANVGSWEWDVATDTVIWSEELYRIFGRNPADGAPSFAAHPELYHPDDMRRLRDAADAAVHHGTPYELELRAIRADGKTRICLARGHAEMGPENRAVRLFGSLQDITERKQGEEDLRRIKEELQLTLDAISDGIWKWNFKTGEMHFSHQYYRMLGYEPEEFPAGFEAWKELIHPDDLENTLLQAENYLKNKPDRYENEFRLRMKDGNYRWIHTVGKIVERDEAGGAVRMIGSHQDITDRKHADTEREKLQAQLLQAQKMESVGRLAGGVAHDFNNMLGVIIGHAEMALEDVDPALPIHSDLSEIRNAAERSVNITKQLLAFARRQPIAPRILDLNETVEGMLKMLRRLIGEDIDLAWLPGKSLWPVRMDPSQIDQMLANLCVNARDAIPGVGKITIETANTTFDRACCSDHLESAVGDYVMLAVSDTGCGMDSLTRENLFEPFFTTKEIGKGTGLGLATVYGIVKQNDGFIHVCTEPGQGTTLRIYLNRHTGESGQLHQEDSDQQVPHGHETILLVEDELKILNMATMMLRRLGYSVLGANTPDEAIGLARTHSGDIHLLMTDVVMPEMNGRDLAGHLMSAFPGMKCLFMSGYTADVIAQHGVLNPGVQFIQKPFSMMELAKKIREALGEKAEG